jgi:hypothetical protein
MGTFIYKAQISPKYFLNFADADPQPSMAADMIYRYGKDIHDNDMMMFGAWYRTSDESMESTFHYFRNFFALFIQQEYQNAKQGLPLPKEVWFPDLEVMMARDKQGSTDGFFVAAKGGNNDESHNHNDIGNFIVYYNGYPLLIDVGRGTYTRKTFSDQRYDIWYNCSDYHNLPTINGKDQLPGAEYKSRNVRYKSGKDDASLTLDIAPAYPKETGINSWTRNITLNRGKNVQLDDVFQLSDAQSIVHHFMTCYPAEVAKPGELIIHYAPKDSKAMDFIIGYNPSVFDVSVEKIKLEKMEDKGIQQKWGDTIHRINLIAKDSKVSGKHNFIIKPKE